MERIRAMEEPESLKREMSMESEENRIDYLTCRWVQDENAIRVSIGTDRLLPVEIDAGLPAAASKSGLFSAPLTPYRNAFEAEVYAVRGELSTWCAKLEKKREDQQTIRLRVGVKLPKEYLLTSEEFPYVKFRLESKNCLEGTFGRLQKGDEVEAQIVSWNVVKRLVNVKTRFKQVSLDDLKKMINRKVEVAVHAFDPRMGVFVEFKGYAGIAGLIGLHHRGADMAAHYQALVGKTMAVYLFGIDEERNKLIFSENTLFREKEAEPEAEITMQPGEVVSGIPNCFHASHGVYVRCRGLSCLVGRRDISDEMWKRLPQIYTLGETYSFRVKLVNLERKRVYLSLMTEAEAEAEATDRQAVRLIREVDEGLPIGSEQVTVPYNAGLYGLLLRYENYLGMLPYHQAPRCISLFRKEIVEKKLPFRVTVEAYEGKYSFTMQPYMEKVLAEMGEVSTLRMQVEAVAAGGELLLSYRGIYAGLYFEEPVWKNTLRELPRFKEGDEIEVGICKPAYAPSELEVSLVPTPYNPWMASALDVGQVVEAEIVEVENEGVNVVCDGLYGVLEPRFQVPGYTYTCSEVVQVLVVAIDRANGKLRLAHNRNCFALAGVQDLAVGDDCLVQLRERIAGNIALAELNGKEVLVRFDALNEVAALVLFSKKRPSAPLQGRVVSVSEWGTVLLEADGRRFGGVDYQKFVKGNVMEWPVGEVSEDGYVLDCHGVAGLLPFTEIEKLWPQTASYAVGDRVTVAFLEKGTELYPLLFSTKLLTEEHWKMLDVAVGQEVDVKVVGITTCVVVSYQGVLGTIQPLDVSLKKRYVLAEEVVVGDVLRVEVLKRNIQKRQLRFSRRKILQKIWDKADLAIGKTCTVQVKKREGMYLEVEYGGLPGIIGLEYLSWSHPSLAVKLMRPGNEKQACIVSVDRDNYCIHFNARLLEENPWTSFPYRPGDPAKAEIKQLSASDMLLDVRGILTSLDKADACWMAGKQELVPLETLPWQVGDVVEVKIVRVEPAESVLEVEPVAGPVVYKAGDVCRMQIQSVHQDRLDMCTYRGDIYKLPLEEVSWFALSDLRGIFVRGKELAVTLLGPDKRVGLKSMLPDPWKTFCYGHQFRAALTGVLPSSLIFQWEGNLLPLSAPEALHIPPEYLERMDLRNLFTEGETFELRVVTFQPDWQKLEIGILWPCRIAPVARYRVVAVWENERLVRGAAGWGVVGDAPHLAVGSMAWLALDRQHENGFLLLTSVLQGHPVELYGCVLSCRALMIHPDYLELRAEDYEYLTVRLPWDEWSWTTGPGERPCWEELAEVSIRVEVIQTDPGGQLVYVSRKALMDDPRGWEELHVGDVCGLTIRQVSAKALEVTGHEWGGMIPVEDWNGRRMDDCADFFRAGNRLRAKIMGLNEVEKTASLSLKALTPDPWAEVRARWKVGDVFDFTVCQVTEKHLFLQRAGLIIPLVAAEVYWQAGNQLVADYQIGQVVQAKITAIDCAAYLISLSIRDLHANPLETKSLPREGDIVEGVVSRIHNRHVFVHCGEWIVRVMPDDLVWGILQEKIEPYQVGERVRCLVQRLSLDKRTILGSIRDLLPRPEKQYPLGEICLTTIYQFVPQGILVSYEGYKGFIPLDDIPFAIDEIKEAYHDRMQLWAYLKEVDFKHHKLIFSLEAIGLLIREGECGKARVVEVKPEGVEVIFHQIPVLIPAEELDWRTLEDSSVYFHPGEEVDVRVMKLHPYYNELTLSIKRTIENPWVPGAVAVGDTIETTVHHTSLKMIYFAYKGLWGKITYKEALWQTGYKLPDQYVAGGPLRCRVTEFDPANYLLKASITALQEDPFNRLPFGEKDKVELTVVNVGPLGLRVAVGEWLGYLPYEEFAWFKLDDPAALYAEGDRLTAVCKEIHKEAHTILFSLRLLMNPGQVEEVTVEEVRKEGVKVRYFHLPVFIPNEELSWSSLADAAVLFQEQDRVKVTLATSNKADAGVDTEKAFLSVKRVTADPWVSADLRRGETAEGVVLYRDRKNMYVACRDLVGKIAYEELFWQAGHTIADHYAAGQPVTFRILEIDRLARSWKGSVKALQEDLLACMPFGVGDKVRVVVNQVGLKGVRVKTGNYLGYIPFEEYDWETVEHPEEKYKEGDELDVICKKIDKELRNIHFSIRMLTPDPMGGLLPGSRVKAKIREVRETGLTAVVNEHIRAVIPKGETSWKYQAGYDYPVPLPALFSVGGEVDALVTAVDRDRKELLLSLKALRQDPCLTCREGDLVALTILEVLKKGQLLVEWDDFIGSMMKHQAFYQKDVRLLYLPGEKLPGKILKVNPDDRRIFLTAKFLYADPFIDLSLQVGDVVPVRIIRKGLEGLLVELDNRIRALIPLREVGYRYDEVMSDGRFCAGDLINARITGIDSEAKTVALSVKDLAGRPEERQIEVGSDQEVFILSEEEEGLLVTVRGWFGWIPREEADYKDAMSFEQRTRLDKGRSYRARVTGVDACGTFLLSLKALIPNPYEKYRSIARKQIVRGRVFLLQKAGFFVELEDAVAYISQRNLTWNPVPDWPSFFEIGKTYDFKILNVKDERITLTCLEELPFNENGEASGTILRKDDEKVYVEVNGIEMFVSRKDASLDLFNTALGGRDIREGTRVTVRREKIDFREHTLQVSIVSI